MAHHAIFISVSIRCSALKRTVQISSYFVPISQRHWKKCLSNKYAPRTNTVRTHSSKNKFHLLEVASYKKTRNIHPKTFVKSLHPIYSKQLEKAAHWKSSFCLNLYAILIYILWYINRKYTQYHVWEGLYNELVSIYTVFNTVEIAYKLILRLIVSHQLQTPILVNFILDKNLKLNTVVAWLCSGNCEEWQTTNWDCFFTADKRERKGRVMFCYFWFRYSRLLPYRTYFFRKLLHCKWKASENQIQMSGSHSCIPKNETVQPHYFQNRIIMFCLPIPTLIYLWDIYIFPG